MTWYFHRQPYCCQLKRSLWLLHLPPLLWKRSFKQCHYMQVSIKMKKILFPVGRIASFIMFPLGKLFYLDLKKLGTGFQKVIYVILYVTHFLTLSQVWGMEGTWKDTLVKRCLFLDGWIINYCFKLSFLYFSTLQWVYNTAISSFKSSHKNLPCSESYKEPLVSSTHNWNH